MAEKKPFQPKLRDYVRPPYRRSVSPASWQQQALDNIHVYEAGGLSSAVPINTYGKIASKNIDNAKALIPLQLFRIDHEKELRNFIRPLINHAISEPLYMPEIFSEFVDRTRRYLHKKRPEDYVYRPTPDEDVQIKRIFIELNKYPEISSYIFENGAPEIVVTPHGKTMIEFNPEENEKVAGDANQWRQRIRIVDDGASSIDADNDRGYELINGYNLGLADIVSEEVLHIYDKVKGVQRKKEGISSGLTEDMIEKRSKLWEAHADLLSRLERRAKGEHVSVSEEEQTFFTQFVEWFQSRIKQERNTSYPLALNPELSRDTDAEPRALRFFARIVGEMQDIMNFGEHDVYRKKIEAHSTASGREQAQAEQNRTELFAKIGKKILLLRNYSKQIAAQYEPVERYLFSDNLSKAVITELDEAKRHYEAIYSLRERIDAERFAELQVAAIESEFPFSTQYQMDYKKYGLFPSGKEK